jgi:MFS family permease
VSSTANESPWYADVTRYQWLVLLIASLGWIFDVFEGQIFVTSMNEAMPSLVADQVASLSEADRTGLLSYYKNITLAAFLVGGAIGGVVFGVLSDRIGRTKTMVYTIIMYSVFTCFSSFSQTWWQMAIMRFLVAMGVGGEWAVASAMVAEVFPKRARAWSLGIFHASSVLGTLLAIAAGKFIIGNPAFQNAEYPSLPWRIGFGIGVLPALLIIWIRTSLHEPEEWEQARSSALAGLTKKLGSFAELFGPGLLRSTLIGVGLAAVGLATFWGVHVYGKELMLRSAERQYLSTPPADHAPLDWKNIQTSLVAGGAQPEAAAASVARAEKAFAGTADFANAEAALRATDEPADPLLTKILDRARALWLKPYQPETKHAEMLGMLLVTLGGGVGLLSFGPICEWLGRRPAFLLFHIGGLASALVLFQYLAGGSAGVLMIALPIFGYWTLGMHAGYAIYFPELFPTRLRGTGGGFCFNVGRLVAAPCLYASGWIQSTLHVSFDNAVSLLSLLYLVGVVLLIFAPETKGQDLPE